MRKTTTIIINDGGNALNFKITQMPASKLERWINRVILLLAKGSKGMLGATEGKEFAVIQEAIQKNGIEGLSKLLGNIEYEDLEPLYDELLTCCSRVMDNYEQPCSKDTVDAFVTDFRTLYKLRLEVLKLNFNFFTVGGDSPEREQTHARHHDFQEYPNVSGKVAVVVSRKLATLHELQTIYSYEDLLDLYEIVSVNSINEQIISKGMQE